SSGGANKAFKTTGGTAQSTYTITAGSSSVSFLYYDELAGTYNITLTNNATSPTLTNPSALSFTVNPAAASQIALSGASSSTAGVNSNNITATLEDQFGNAATRSGNVVVTPASSSGGANKAFKTTGGSAQSTYTITAGSSSVSFLYYDELAGTYNITLTNNATSPTLTNPSALSFTVNPAAASQIALSGASSSTAGVNSNNITATLEDQFGNAATRSGNVVVTPASSSGGANKAFKTTGGTAQSTYTITAGSSSVSFRYYDELAGTYNITLTNNATSPTLTNPSALSFTVNPAAASQIALSGASSSTAGVNSGNLTATLEDQFGNAATRSGNVVVTPASSSGGANKAFKTTGGAAQATYTITAGSSSVSFLYYDELAGTYNITLTNNATSPTLTNPSALSFTVNAAAASKLAFDNTSAISGTAGLATCCVVVDLEDAFGNPAKPSSTLTITPSSSSTSSSKQFRTSGGVVASSFTIGTNSTSVSFKYYDETAGTYNISLANDSGGSISNPSALSFTVGAAGINGSTSTISTNSSSVSTDAGNSATVTVTVKDGFGNTVSGSSVTLTQTGGSHATISPNNGIDFSTGTGTTGSNGQVAFTVADSTAEGPFTYSATASGVQVVPTVSISFVSGTPTHMAFLVQPSNVGSGQTITPAVKVELLDAHNNLTTSSESIKLQIHNDANPTTTLTGGGAVSASNGVATFSSVSLNHTGNGYTLDAVDNGSAGLATVTSSSFNVVVAPGLTYTSLTGDTYHPSGTNTVYFRSGGSGSFVLTATPSGQQTYNFPASGSLPSGWTRTPTTDSSQDHITLSFTSGASGGTGNPVSYTNGATTSGTTNFDLVDDSTAPTGGSISIPSATNSTSVTVTATNYTDGQSGIASNVIKRYKLVPSGSTCPTTLSSYTLDSSSVTLNGSNQDTGLTVGDCYMYTLTGTDNVNNTATTQTSNGVLIDQTPPSVTAASINGTTLTLTWSKTLATTPPTAGLFAVTYDGVSIGVNNPVVSGNTITLTLGSSPNNSEVVKISYTTPGTGQTGVFDSVGNAALAFSNTTVTNNTPDTTAPGVAFDSPTASAYTNQSTLHFTFHATRSSTSSTTESGDTFQCAIDGGSYSACTSPYTTPSLADGAHVLHVKATDSSSNTSSAATSVTMTIDTVPPVVTLDTTPANPTNVNNHAVFTFHSTDANNSSVTFQCKLDGGSFSACTSGVDLATGTLSDGSHTATIQATDGAGNTSSQTYTWTVDTVAPTITSITATNANGSYTTGTVISVQVNFSKNVNVVTTGGTPTLTLNTSPSRAATYSSGSGTGTLVFTYTVQAGDNTSGNLNTTAVNLNSGTIKDAATNNATLTIPSGQSLSNNKAIVIDTTPPVAPTISAPANGGTTGASTTVTISGESGATLKCSVDNAAFGSCPASLSSLTAGSHNIRVTATDAAGNTSPIATSTWTVDLSPPVITITGPANPTPLTTASFALSSNKSGTTATCSLDNNSPSAYVTCPGSDPTHPTYNGLSAGSHTLYVLGTDSYGNADTTPASYTWVIDTNAPAITGPSSPSSNRTPSLSWTMNETSGWTFKCSLDGATASTCTSPVTTSSLNDGSHSFAVTAYDANNNASTTSTYSWTVDTHIPGTPGITSGPSSPSNTSTPTFTFTGDTGSTFLCSIDGGSYTACSTPYTTPTLADGHHTLSVEEVSQAGVVNTTATNYNSGNGWTIDTTAPAAPTITSGPASSTTSTNASLVFQASDPTDTNLTFQCDLDGGGYSTCVSPMSYVSVSLGIHTFSVKATDQAGNVGPAGTYQWTVGATGGGGGSGSVPPHLVSENPDDGSTVSSVGPTVSVTFDRTVNITNAKLTDPSGNVTNLANATASTWTFSYSATAPGLYIVTATISDGVNSPIDVETHWTIWTAPSSSSGSSSGSTSVPPPVSTTAYPASVIGTVNSGSLTMADKTATVSWPAAAVPSDGMVIKMAPQSTVSPPTGASFAAGSTPIDVTAHTLLNSVAITTFSDPITVNFPDADSSTIPAVSTDGGATWRFLQQLDSPSLPPGSVDGFYRNPAGGLTVYTMHLTLYALLGDKQPPTAPANLGAGVNNGQLVLRWDPASDNSGCIGSYTVWIDGQAVKVLNGSTYEYYVGPAAVGDTHVYRISATDCSGNDGPLSNAVTGVPNLVGLSDAQAQAALQAAGLTAGVVTNIGSGQKVDAQSPSTPAYVNVGSSVDYTLGLTPSALRAPLSVHVVGSHRINPVLRHYVAIRIQLNQSSQVTSTLRSSLRRIVGLWTRNLRAGTFIIRYQLPTNLGPDHYRLTVVAITNGTKQAYTVPVTIRSGQAPVLTTPRVVVVGDANGKTSLRLSLKARARVLVTSGTSVFNVVGSNQRVVALAVNVDQNGVALIHNLHIVFPTVKIVAITNNAARAVRARTYGAAAVVFGSSQSASSFVSKIVDGIVAGSA
ncbi:MAG: PASTA domain-containing protein, partial [Actinobacteria bacterium]|nr:PASTA domain-containing protein [Actinomycetota bacterium]